jgi:putative cardiolipin synthase
MDLRRAALCLVLPIALALSACSGLPVPSSSAMPVALATNDTEIAQNLAPLEAANPAKSGIYMLRDGREAFAARAVLVNAAQRSLDVQYYIWHKDITGVLLFNGLAAAADRGVRVRLLLDDNNTKGLDPTLAMLDAHPNIEVRLFNPFMLRGFRPLGYLTDFSRLNRRMHNKSLTVDGHATIIGGRNIGDEYFGAAGEVLFSDLDVLAVGPVAADVEQDFDQYWNSGSSYAASQIIDPATPESIAAVKREAATITGTPAVQEYLTAIKASTFVADIRARKLPLEWVKAQLVSDNPAKGLGKAPPSTRITPQLREVMGSPVKSFDVVSPYFVPGKEGADAFVTLARKGVDVRVLTNSLAATDVAAVHAGYAKRRVELLKGGVHLYELRRTWAAGTGPASGPFGSSASSLHAKTFAVDGDQLFIGSYNLDPRSARLNTEMGFILDSPTLAGRLRQSMATGMPDRAYEVQLNKEGKLIWLEHKNGTLQRYTDEPDASIWRKLEVSIMEWLPIEWLL